MVEDASRWRRIRALALLISGVSLVVVVLSIFLRLDAAGLGCANWPACYGSLLSSPQVSMHYSLPRLLHRSLASLDLLLVCWLVWQCLRPRVMQPVARDSVVLLILILVLAVLGVFSADPGRVLVSFLNIVGGLMLVGFSWWVAGSSKPASASPVAVNSLRQNIVFGLGAFALALAILLGAWIGATYSALACSTVPDCNGMWWPTMDVWSALNPGVRVGSAALSADPGAASLHLLHRGMALLALLMLGAVALSRLRDRATRSGAAHVLLFLLLTTILGSAAVKSGFNLWLVVGHGLGASLLLAALGSMIRR